MKWFLVLVIALFQVSDLFAAPPAPPIRVVCVGDSITEGTYGHIYPTIMRMILGDGYVVGNFGVGSATLLPSQLTYMKTDAYKKALASRPDVVIILLGTNDTKPATWARKGVFVGIYKQLITSFQSLPSRPKVFICLPPPAGPNDWGIRGNVVKTEVIPRIESVAKATGATLIDLNTPLTIGPAMYSDNVHPNAAGATLVATTVAAAIRGKAKVGGPMPGTPGAEAPLPNPKLYSASAELVLPDNLKPVIPKPQVVNLFADLVGQGKTYRLSSTQGSFWLVTQAPGARDRLFLVQKKGAPMAGAYGFGSEQELTVNGQKTTTFPFPLGAGKIQSIVITTP